MTTVPKQPQQIALSTSAPGPRIRVAAAIGLAAAVLSAAGWALQVNLADLVNNLLLLLLAGAFFAGVRRQTSAGSR